MFFELILSFLQYDLLNLFSLSNADICFSCSSHDVASPGATVDESCIINVYEPRPTIVPDCQCGCQHCPVLSDREKKRDLSRCDCTQLNDGANVDVCSVKSSVNVPLSAANSECNLNTASDSTCCQSISQEIAETVANRCPKSNEAELKVIEERACELWNILSGSARVSCNRKDNFPQWWDLKSWQKLPFYWAALSNEILSESPFENFKRFFVENKRRRRPRDSKHETKRVLNMWHDLCLKQRLPFIMEAFIAKVSAGKVNTHDDCEIRTVINDLYHK